MNATSTLDPLPRTLLRRELLASGIDDRAIARRLRASDLCRIRHGAYVDARQWHACDERARHRVRSRAILRQAKTPLVLSHTSALAEWGVALWDADLVRVDVTRNDRRGGRREAGVRQHYGVLRSGDVTHHDGVPVTSPSRTALDVMTLYDAEHSLAAVNELLHHGLATPVQLREQAERVTWWPRSISKHVVLRLATGACESVGESRVLYLCWDQCLPAPSLRFEVLGRHGRPVARVDFAWPELGVFLEFDGRVKYQALVSERDSVTDVVVREKRREELICELTGWRCIRVTWSDLQHPDRVAARVRAMFDTHQSRARRR